MSSVSIRIDKSLYDLAVKEARAEYRSAPQQITFWAKIGQNALSNPDLPIEFIRDTLIAKEQESEPFKFEGDK
jgi:hypothetical protein